ncbi:translation initiation factor IF-2 isoform X1 [Mustela erminea]|uniref:translation initiation factor IF-2 isoform X1 n=1 Tax=Mustela erminea TaxID=36723 RepID=UPI0013870F4E|nr:translation initiation factor IF-2 isoform X1 [Mustela erminea]
MPGFHSAIFQHLEPKRQPQRPVAIGGHLSGSCPPRVVPRHSGLQDPVASQGPSSSRLRLGAWGKQEPGSANCFPPRGFQRGYLAVGNTGWNPDPMSPARLPGRGQRGHMDRVLPYTGATDGGCAGEGRSKWPQMHLRSGSVALISLCPSAQPRRRIREGGYPPSRAGVGRSPLPSNNTPHQHPQRNSGVGPQTSLAAKTCAADTPCQNARPASSRRLSGKGKGRILEPRRDPRQAGPGETPNRTRQTEVFLGPWCARWGTEPSEEKRAEARPGPRRLRPHVARVPLPPAFPGLRPRRRPAPTSDCAPREARTPSLQDGAPPLPAGPGERLASPPPFPPPRPVSPPSPRATGGGGGGRSGPSRSFLDLARSDVANQRAPELRALLETQLDLGPQPKSKPQAESVASEPGAEEPHTQRNPRGAPQEGSSPGGAGPSPAKGTAQDALRSPSRRRRPPGTSRKKGRREGRPPLPVAPRNGGPSTSKSAGPSARLGT